LNCNKRSHGTPSVDKTIIAYLLTSTQLKLIWPFPGQILV